MPSQRVSPPRIFPEASRASRPPAGAGGAGDAHRQAGFVLGEEIDAVVQGLELEGACAQASAGAKYRHHVTAAALGLWSRAWLSRLEALHSVEWGNYAGAVPLVRAAADYQACEVLLLSTGASEWEEYLDGGGIALDPEDHALQFELHPFRAAEILAADPALGPVYREASALALPHFGATLLLMGSDSSPERVLMTFGDRDFHLGLAEIVIGWLLRLGAAQLRAIQAAGSALAAPDGAAIERWLGRAERHIARADRCRIAAEERDGMARYLISNWRRAPGAAPKKVLL